MKVELFKSEQQGHYYPDDAHTQTVRTRTRIILDTDKDAVTKVISAYLTGLNRTSQKRWWRWQTTTADQIRLTPSGRFVNLNVQRPVGKPGLYIYADNAYLWRQVFGEPAYRWGRDLTFYHAVRSQFGELSLEAVYPMANIWGIDNPEHLPKAGAKFLKEKDPKAMVQKMFGKRHYRKDLMKAVLNNPSICMVMLARSFRGRVPTDWMVNFLNKNQYMPRRVEVAQYADYNYERMRQYLLPYLSPNDYRRLLRSEITPIVWRNFGDVMERGLHNTSWLLPEIPQMVQNSRVRIRNFGDLHDVFWPRYRQAPAVADYLAARRRGEIPAVINRPQYTPPPPVSDDTVIPVTELGGKIEARNVFRLPATVGELRGWGNDMRNCIGSYARDVMREDANTVLGAFVHPEDGKIIANFEVTNGRLKQLLGKTNTVLPEPVRKLAEFEFRECGVIIEDGYWGSGALY
jgi:hypothetical protein